MPLILSSATEVHVQLGNGAPVFLPTSIGQHYIDVANKRLYQSVGISKVEDWGSPLATAADLEAFDKTVTKGEVGLGNVENYGVASKPEAEAGLLNNLYMTPLRVTELMNALFMPTLTAFMGRADNPHDVTATQVGALTVAETEALLALKMSEGDVAGLLDTFWASKIGAAPETMDTIEEIALALQNNPLVIEALQSLVDGNRLTIVEAMDAIAALQALVGESTAFLTAESDLGVNPVALTGDEGTARDLKAILEGMVAKDAAQDQALTDARDALQTQIGTKADKVATEAALGGLQTAVEGLGTQISDNEQAATDAIQAVQDAVVTEKGEREAADLVLDQKVDAAVLALEENKVGRTDNIDTNTVTEGEGEEAVQVALSTLIAQLKAGIAQAGDATELEALQQAFNAFVAAKASSAEVLEGLDNAKYTTSVGVKAAIDTAIAALVDGAPEALDTINELAAALQNNPDVITALQTLVSENASTLGLVADRVTAIEAELPNKVDQGGDITDNTVVVSDSAVALGELITQLQSAIAQAGDASALEALQQAFNAFVAAKATAEEAITGTDDEKYLTSVSAKAAIAAAVDDLVGAAPEALDTVYELASALNNDPDIINTLMTQIGTKATTADLTAAVDSLTTQITDVEQTFGDRFDVGGRAKDAALLEGATKADIVAETNQAVAANTQAISANAQAIADLGVNSATKVEVQGVYEDLTAAINEAAALYAPAPASV